MIPQEGSSLLKSCADRSFSFTRDNLQVFATHPHSLSDPWFEKHWLKRIRKSLNDLLVVNWKKENIKFVKGIIHIKRLKGGSTLAYTAISFWLEPLVVEPFGLLGRRRKLICFIVLTPA